MKFSDTFDAELRHANPGRRGADKALRGGGAPAGGGAAQHGGPAGSTPPARPSAKAANARKRSDTAKHGRRLPSTMLDRIAALTLQGCPVAQIQAALESEYGPLAPDIRTTRRHVQRANAIAVLRALAGSSGDRPGDRPDTGPVPPPPDEHVPAPWDLAGPVAEGPGARPAEPAPADLLPVLRAALMAGLPWPNRDAVYWWAWVRQLAPDLPPVDVPSLAGVWRARRAMGLPTRDLVAFLAFAPWRGRSAFAAYLDWLTTPASQGIDLYTWWQDFGPVAAAYVADLAWHIAHALRAELAERPGESPAGRPEEGEPRLAGGARWTRLRVHLARLLATVAMVPPDRPNAGPPVTSRTQRAAVGTVAEVAQAVAGMPDHDALLGGPRLAALPWHQLQAVLARAVQVITTTLDALTPRQVGGPAPAPPAAPPLVSRPAEGPAPALLSGDPLADLLADLPDMPPAERIETVAALARYLTPLERFASQHGPPSAARQRPPSGPGRGYQGEGQRPEDTSDEEAPRAR